MTDHELRTLRAENRALRQEVADLRAANAHSLALLARSETRAAALERTARDLLAELDHRTRAAGGLDRAPRAEPDGRQSWGKN